MRDVSFVSFRFIQFVQVYGLSLSAVSKCIMVSKMNVIHVLLPLVFSVVSLG